MPCMKKLKTILESKYTYIIVFLVMLIFINVFKYESNYDKNTNKIIGIIDKIKIDGDKLTLEIKGKEKIICNYYLKTEKEKNYFQKQLILGMEVELIGEIKEPNVNTNFGLFNYKNYLKSKKIFYTFTVENIKVLNENVSFLYKIKNTIINRIENLQNKEYLYAFIMGDSSHIEESVRESYQTNGISHLLALSGMHVTLLFSTILKALNKIKKTKLNFLMVCILLGFYLFLTGAPPSLVRATLLFVILNISKIGNIKIKTSYALSLIFCLLMMYNKYYIYNMGFLLSFTVCFYLTLFNIKGRNYFESLLLTSIVAFIAGTPIIISNYNTINILSVLLNLLFVPLVTFLVFPLSIIYILTNTFGFLLNFFINILELLSVVLSKVSVTFILKDIGAFIIIYIIIGIFVLKKIKQKKYRYLLLYLLLFMFHSNLFSIYPEVTFLDVGQGDSYLIELPYNKGNILIDTGGVISYKEEWAKRKSPYSIGLDTIIPYLKKRGIKKLNYLILTHGDHDHMGEAINLVNNFKVEKVIFNNDTFNDLELNLVKILKEKNIKYYKNMKSISLDKNKLHFLNNELYDNENDNSNVIYTELNNHKFLFMGDAGVEVEKNIIEKYNLQNIDVLKVGHHGSKTSSGKKFINEINPEYGVISVGKNNRYGHPNDGVLENLEDSNIYRTDQDGSIMFKVKKNKLEIKNCSP